MDVATIAKSSVLVVRFYFQDLNGFAIPVLDLKQLKPLVQANYRGFLDITLNDDAVISMIYLADIFRWSVIYDNSRRHFDSFDDAKQHLYQVLPQLISEILIRSSKL